MDKKISLIIPCFNEAENIQPLYREIIRYCADLDMEIIFINDASTDETADKIHDLNQKDNRVRILSFEKNQGHQIALRAGIEYAAGDYIIMLDADLQHPPRYIPEMVKKAGQGFDIVNMVHSQAQSGFLKSFLSRNFYRFFSAVTEVQLTPGVSDFRLITARVQKIIKMLPERNLFLRAILPYLGFKCVLLDYMLQKRHSGRPAYTLGKSFAMGKEAIFNFSTFPIKFFFHLGIIVAFMAFIYGLVNVVLKFITDWSVPGYTDIIASVLFLCGLN
ncbi:MAG: glycosyltransferase family 2 protein, partial [bacterium]